MPEEILKAFFKAAIEKIVDFFVWIAQHAFGWVHHKHDEHKHEGSEPDHQILIKSPQGWALHANLSANKRKVRVLVGVGPSFSPPHHPVNAHGAESLVERNVVPNMFLNEGGFFTRKIGRRFDVNPNGPDDGYLWVWDFGRIDINCEFELLVDSDGQPSVSVLDLAKPLLWAYRMINSNDYSELFGGEQIHRHIVDWFVAVSPSLQDEKGFNVPWNDLTFPGAKPKKISAEQRIFSPVRGIGRDELESWDTRRSSAELVSTFVEAFLDENGYDDFDIAIRDILSTLNLS